MCAAQAPERVRGLALLDADWGHVPHGYLLAWAIAHTPSFPAALRRLRSDTRHIARLMRLAYGHAFSVDDALIEQYTAPLRVHGTAKTLVHLGRAALDSNIAGIPATLHCPSLIIWGDADYIIPVEWASKLAQKMPTSTLITLPAIGHFPQEEAPGLVLAHLQPFLAQFS
jgi:pimeloyl-ACP methyl ester carboxylesterase